MVFGAAHAQVGESSGIPYYEEQNGVPTNGNLTFSPVPVNTLRVIKMVNCLSSWDAGSIMWVSLNVITNPFSLIGNYHFPMVQTVPFAGGGHQANSNNDVFVLLPSGSYPLISLNDAKGSNVKYGDCTLTGYDVPSSSLKVGGTGD
jgi:hypothetical protein